MEIGTEPTRVGFLWFSMILPALRIIIISYSGRWWWEDHNGLPLETEIRKRGRRRRLTQVGVSRQVNPLQLPWDAPRKRKRKSSVELAQFSQNGEESEAPWGSCIPLESFRASQMTGRDSAGMKLYPALTTESSGARETSFAKNSAAFILPRFLLQQSLPKSLINGHTDNSINRRRVLTFLRGGTFPTSRWPRRAPLLQAVRAQVLGIPAGPGPHLRCSASEGARAPEISPKALLRSWNEGNKKNIIDRVERLCRRRGVGGGYEPAKVIICQR